MKLRSSPLLGTLACLLGLLSTDASAQATYSATAKFDFGAPCNSPTCKVELSPTESYTANVSGYSANSGSAYVPGTVTNQSDSSGLGFTGKNGLTGGAALTEIATDGKNHAFDNAPESSATGWQGHSNELLLINFGSAKVNLSQIQTGWSTSDTDVMVFRWDGTTAPDMTQINGSGGLVAAGWNLVSAKDLDVTGSTDTTTWNTTKEGTDRTFDLSSGTGWTASNTDKVSSWWMVTTYFGTTNSGAKLETTTADYFKLLSFSGKVCTSTVKDGVCIETPPDETGNIPEPASMALIGAALAGLAIQRRRRTGILPSLAHRSIRS